MKRKKLATLETDMATTQYPDGTYGCGWVRANVCQRIERERDAWKAEIKRLRSGLEEIATHEQNVGATVIYSGEWCVNKAKEVLKLCKNLS